MLYPSRTYFKQSESFRDFSTLHDTFSFEIYTEQFAPMYTWGIYLWRYDVGDSQPFIYNSPFIWTRLHEYNFRFRLVTLCHIMWVYFTVLQMPICNLLGSISFGYLYYIQVYRSISPRSYKIVMELPFSIFSNKFCWWKSTGLNINTTHWWNLVATCKTKIIIGFHQSVIPYSHVHAHA